jgi:PTH1 family peptidyl-tRNA hydrolase
MPYEIFLLGLGNPGSKYAGTRHNAGFMLIDRIAAGDSSLCWVEEPRYMSATARIAGVMVLLVKPTTYMNLSGGAVTDLMSRESLVASDLLVVCDDFNLPLGTIRLRRSGSAGGHNGLKSIIDALGTEVFPRLRLGVGPLPAGSDAADFVLSDFTEEEMEAADGMLARGEECIQAVILRGLDDAMSRFNAKLSDSD